MEKVKTVSFLVISALLTMPLLIPTAKCVAPRGCYFTHKSGTRHPYQFLTLSKGQRLGTRALVFHNISYRIIDRLSADMPHEQWNSTMQQILDRVWQLNQLRLRYAQEGNRVMTENLQEEVWDILFYLLDHLTFRCDSGYRMNFGDMIMILYYASGGDITEAETQEDYDEQFVAQGRIMDENLMRWASRPLNPHSYQFALDALRRLWYDTALHQYEWEANVSDDFVIILRYSIGLRQVLTDACMAELAMCYGRAQYTEEYSNNLMSRISSGGAIDETMRSRNVEDYALRTRLSG